MKYLLIVASIMLSACAPAIMAGAGGAGVGTGIFLANVTATKEAIDVAVPEVYKLGCYGVSTAHGAFLAAAPALIASGKISEDVLLKEASIMHVADARCANPPADTVQAGLDMLADASTIYLLLTTPK